MTTDTVIFTSMVAAISAIFAPVITAMINSKSLERQKRMELFDKNVLDCVAELAKAYSELNENTVTYMEQYWAFSTATYKVIALINDTPIQNQLKNLLDILITARGHTDPVTNDMFNVIMLNLSKYIAAWRK